MAAAQTDHLLRMEKAIAWLRLPVVFLAAVAVLDLPRSVSGSGSLIATIWGTAVLYAGIVLAMEPYRHVPPMVWYMTSGFIDWALISLGIIATGGARSELYLLYFLLVLSTALRFGFREVLIGAIGTVVGYFLIVLAASSSPLADLQTAAFRMGYLVLGAVGSGVMAQEIERQFRGRIREEAQRLAVQEVTATLGHDLKNPLAAVGGLLEMLTESLGTLAPGQRALVDRIKANTQQMTDLVTNLLDAELIETGHQSFQPVPINLNLVVRRIVEAQANQAEIKHIGLLLDLCDDLPVAELDGRMMERLVANLLGNAVKFTPENGAIRLSTRVGSAQLRLEVWDSGPDIPSAVRVALFEKFVRQGGSPGVGLGLYICKTIVDLHGGTIGIRKGGGGVAFMVELPLAQPVTAKAQGLEIALVPPQPGALGWSAPLPFGGLARGLNPR